jgi:hypothetical protein
LNLNSATSDEIIDYFFSHKRISGQNLLYSIFLELGTTYYDNYDTPLKLKISTTDNSVSAKFASDFEFDFGLSPLGSSKQQIKRGIDMILKDSYIKIQVSQSEICVEASVTQRV